MKILITGATGFIGKSVCEALSREGHELVVVTRDPDHARAVIPAPHRAVKWDFSADHSPDHADLIKNIDAVVHLAGEPIFGRRWDARLKDQLYHSRVTSTQNLISLLKTNCINPPQVFICASAVGYYGDRGDEILDETSKVGRGFLARLCEKWEETLSDDFLKKARKVSLRTGIVLGQGGGALASMIGPYSLGFGGALGSGQQWMSWIHLDDMVQVILSILNDDRWVGPINCCAPDSLRNAEFSKHLAKSVKAREALSIPKVFLKMIFGESAQVLLSSQRVRPSRLLEGGYVFKYPDIFSALESIFKDSYSKGYSEFQTKTWLPLPIHEVFKFFSEAGNLEKITPPWLGFRIISQSSKDITKGTTIDYRLSLHGVPMGWQTLISTWDPPREFTDVQLKGPYDTWEHTHRFSELENGTLMEDRVLYKMPFGYLGKGLAGEFVKRDVSQIFAYRNAKIYELLLNQKEGKSE